MKRLLVRLMLSMTVLGGFIGLWAASSPTIPAPTVTPTIIIAGTSTPVTVTVPIADPTLVTSSINLISVDPSGNQTNLGQMHDDGQNGDALAGDGIYSISYSFSPSSALQMSLAVSAIFRGQLKRVMSPSVALYEWGRFTDTVTGLEVAYPPGIYDISGGHSNGAFLLSNSSQAANVGETGPTSTLANSGFNISMRTFSYQMSSFDINQWLSYQYPYDSVGTVTPLSIAGLPGYEFQFVDEASPEHLIAVVYRNATVIELSYSSTMNSGTSAEYAGLTTFSTIIANLQFAY